MAKFREIFRGKSKYVKVRAESEEAAAKKEVPDGPLDQRATSAARCSI